MTTTGDGAVDAYAADFDNDGDLDVVGACVIEWTASWWENTNGLGTEWTEHVLPGSIYGIMCASAADLNGDGHLDILSAFSIDENIRWWENGGNGDSWTLRTVASFFEDAQSVRAADVDDDGDLDVVGSGGSSVRWWENMDGAGTSWSEHVVEASVNWGHHVNVGDVNGDGDLDIMVAAMMGNDVFWFENLDGTGTSWTTRVVTDSYNGAIHVEAADIDDDDYTDLVTCAAGAGVVTWWRNTDGTGTDWTQNTIATIYSPEYLAVTDFDQDGDPDVAGATYSADGRDVIWWENTGGAWTEHLIQGDFESASSVRAADLSGDGHPDVLGTSYATDRITWWEFEGGTPEPVVLTLTPTSPTDVPAAGGTLVYDAHLISNLSYPVSGLRYWTDVILPSGSPYGPLMVQPFTMTALMDVTVPGLTQTIPAMAPAGVYQFRGHVGYMGGPQVGDSFVFTKQETAMDDGGAFAAPAAEAWQVGGVWTLTGDPTEGEKLDASMVNTRIPLEYALTDVRPNPFNASATITVELPDVSELTVAVYNVAGQRVAELARGRVAAGTHEFAFDGSSLASGIYFVRATVPGRLNALRKVVLVK
ncbi:T9SS type A sorting domain-containing protein [bacterium]|nr:T9SS type A sorting domain-containing protein [bacterium]